MTAPVFRRESQEGWVVRRAAMRGLRSLIHRPERGRPGPYSPDHDDLDVARHLREAMEWLKRAQDAGPDAGVSYGVVFGRNFDLSYPETTGYICRTFVEQADETGDLSLLARAVAMGDWEIDVQLPDGAVMGGKVNRRPTPAVFNTGMVLLGWNALTRAPGEDRFKYAAERAADWLLSVAEPDGRWIQKNSQFALAESTLYNVKAAWGLCETGSLVGDQRYVDAAVRNGEYVLSRQHPNGWIPDCCLTDPLSPLLHTLAYATHGLLGIGSIAGRPDLVAGSRRLLDSLLAVLGPDGYLPGRFNHDFSPGADWCCLTGSAQTSIASSEFFLLTGEERYRDAAISINRYLTAHHDVRNPDPRLRGGLPGSWPVEGDYAPNRILNWATKFLVDALALELRTRAL